MSFVRRICCSLCVIATAVILSSCFGDDGAEEPVSADRHDEKARRPQKAKTPKVAENGRAAAKQDRVAKHRPQGSQESDSAGDDPSDPCKVYPQLESIPHYLPEINVVVTRMLKACVTRGGRSGYEATPKWMVMGFPCTGGTAKLSATPRYATPKIVSFPITTDCPMNPTARGEVERLVQEQIGLSPQSRLLAYNPFVVQYWEIPGLPDAGVGFSIELISTAAREAAWKRVRAKEPLRVRLFGRENAWVAADTIFAVDANLKLEQARTFKLEVVAVKALSKQEVAEVKARCLALRPRRSCQRAF